MTWFELKFLVFISQWAANIHQWKIPQCLSDLTLLTSCFSSHWFSCFVHIWCGMAVDLLTDCLNMLSKADYEGISFIQHYFYKLILFLGMWENKMCFLCFSNCIWLYVTAPLTGQIQLIRFLSSFDDGWWNILLKTRRLCFRIFMKT